MKAKKRRFETLSFYNHTGIAKHLAEMARKGWMIERISNYFWTYRKIEPQELQFTVTYFPAASDFDPGPSEAQQTLMDFCAGTGWKLACTWHQMQVFYNPAADVVPIHTDPAFEVEAVHKACKANYLRIYKVLLVISLVLSLLFLSSVISDTLRILASPLDLMTGVGWLCLFLLCAVELAVYYRWHRRAKKAAEHEIFLDTPSTALFQQALLVILVPFAAYWAANLIFGSEPLMAWVAVMVLLCFVTVAFFVGVVKRLLKRRRFSSIANRLLSAAFSFIITYLLIGAVISVGIHIAKNLPEEELFPHMETPLRVSDLLETEYSDYLTTGSPKNSLLLTWLDIHQRHGFDDAVSPEIPEIRYRLLVVKAPEIYDFCKNQMKRLIVLSAFWDGELVEQDAAPWGADRSYRLVMDDGTETDLYMLCYEDRLAWIEFNWAPNPEQMAIVGEKLGGAR